MSGGEPVVVGATQRVAPHQARQVDVVLDQHDVAHLEAAVETAGRVGDQQRPHAQQEEHTHGVGHLERHTHTHTHTHTQDQNQNWFYYILLHKSTILRLGSSTATHLNIAALPQDKSISKT